MTNQADFPIATFRDPIHGYIDVYQWERDLIDSPEFQRLRRIHQLGFSHYVFHGAEHTRFGHSLGVMFLAGRMVQRLISAGGDLLGWDKAEEKRQTDRLYYLARLAGLLHDVGHAPFSHVGESRLFPPGVNHEEYGARIIESPTTSIAKLLDNNGRLQELGIGSKTVAALIRGKSLTTPQFVRELISSVYDVDKMDYLLRDSLYCGVEYGRYDLGRLIDTYTLYDDPQKGVILAIEEGGVHALEGFILARYFMFTQVYFHPVRRAYDLILSSFIENLMKEETGSGCYPEDVEAYIGWDDYRVMEAARRRNDKDELASRIMVRQHPKSVYETPEATTDPYVRKTAFLDLKPAIEAQFPGVRVWVDQSIDHPDRFRKEGLPVKKSGSAPIWRDLGTESSVLRGLVEIQKVRVFADVRGDIVNEARVRQFCNEFMARR